MKKKILLLFFIILSITYFNTNQLVEEKNYLDKIVAANTSTTVTSWSELSNAIALNNYDTIILKNNENSNWSANTTITIAKNVQLKIDNSNTSALTITRNTNNLLFDIKTGTITIDGQEKGIIIDGTYSSGTKSLINISENAKVTFTNITFKNNKSTENGGAISQTSSSLTLNNCTITNNTAKYGGGIISSKDVSTLTLNNTNITNNTATDGSGGGIYGSSKITINNSNISNNTANTYGGGMIIKAEATIKDTIINENTVIKNSGGGMRIDGTATMTGGEVKNNKSFEYGAGIDFNAGFFTYSNVVLENNTNAGSNGTEIYNIHPDLNSPNNIDWKKDPKLKIEEIQVELLKNYKIDGTGELAPHTGATQGLTVTDKFILFAQIEENDEPTKIHVLDKKTLTLKNTIVVDSTNVGHTFGHANDMAYDKKTGFVYLYTSFKGPSGKVQIAKFKVNNEGQMTDLSEFDTPRGFSGIAIDNDNDQIILYAAEKMWIYDKDFNLKSSFDSPSPLVKQGMGYWKGYIYFTCFEGGTPNMYQTIFNFNERRSNLIYMYDLQGNLAKTLYIPSSTVYGEIEDIEFLDNGEAIISYNSQGISLYKTSYLIQVKNIAINTKPKKLEYIQNLEEFDLSGLKLNVTLNNEEIKTITSTKDVKVEGFDNSKAGEQTIYLVYQGKRTPLQVKILEAQKNLTPKENDNQPKNTKTEKNPNTGGISITILLILLASGIIGYKISVNHRKKLFKI